MERATLIEDMRRLARPLTVEPTPLEPRLDPLPGIRAVLFDIYGTLLISGCGDIGIHDAEDNAGAMAEALATCGFRGDLPGAGARGVELLQGAIREEHELAHAKGVPHPEVEIRELWRHVVAVLAREDLITGGEEAARIERLAVAYECRVNPTWPMPEMEAALEAARRRGLPLGIVSNAQFLTPLLFEAFFDRPLAKLGFDPALMVYSYAEGIGKPDTRLYTTLAETLRGRGIKPEAVLYVGNDMLKDVWTAAQVGFRTALFAGDARSLRLREEDERCQGLKPDAVLTRLDQLDAILAPPA